MVCVEETRCAYRILVNKPEEPFKTAMCKQECNITVDLMFMGPCIVIIF
jgi:hypothetical protein